MFSVTFNLINQNDPFVCSHFKKAENTKQEELNTLPYDSLIRNRMKVKPSKCIIIDIQGVVVYKVGIQRKNAVILASVTSLSD